jgi:hypothetical protein
MGNGLSAASIAGDDTGEVSASATSAAFTVSAADC